MRERIINGVKLHPVDRVARQVTGPGISYTPDKLPNSKAGVTWTEPPTVVAPPPEVPDLRGTRRGRMEVVGFLVRRRDRRRSRGHVWLVRCDCGRYEPRIGETWRSGLNRGSHDACRYCNKLKGSIPEPSPDTRRTQSTVRVWRAPPQTKPHPRLSEWLNARRGKLTVVGYFGNEKNQPKWLVRCDCGLYELRKESTLRKKPTANADQCNACAGEERRDWLRREYGPLSDTPAAGRDG
jgi:hypothetical protein